MSSEQPASATPTNAVSEAAPARPKWVNPYLGHKALSESEAEVLGEYARLAETIKRITLLSAPLSATATHGALLTQLRILERKMGLVLTLFKASVYALLSEQQDIEEDRRRQEEEESGWDQTMGYADETARYGDV